MKYKNLIGKGLLVLLTGALACSSAVNRKNTDLVMDAFLADKDTSLKYDKIENYDSVSTDFTLDYFLKNIDTSLTNDRLEKFNYNAYRTLEEKIKNSIKNSSVPDSIYVGKPMKEGYNSLVKYVGFDKNVVDYDGVKYYALLGAIGKSLEEKGYDYKVMALTNETGDLLGNCYFEFEKDGKEYRFGVNDNYENAIKQVTGDEGFGQEKVFYDSKK